jgi:hypothetical protein
MVVLDFLEWLKNQRYKQGYHGQADVFDLILDEKYHDQLFEFANRYLRDGGYSIRSILHQLIDSEEFEEYLEHYRPFLRDLRHNYRLHPEEIMFFLHDCFHTSNCERAIERIIRKASDEGEHKYVDVDRITAEHLIRSVEHYIERSDEPAMMKFMMDLKANLSLEVDFLDWLVNFKNRPMKLANMPIPVFEDLAEEYFDFAGRHNKGEKVKLVKAFKSNDSIVFSKKLLAVLTGSQYRKMKSLGYIYNRYASHEIPFRCFFLPIAADLSSFEDFIRKYWSDLDSLSGDYLDIFYSEEDFGRSGYAIKESMSMISRDLSEKLPCIVLWCDKLENASHIDIHGLTNDEVFRLIAAIVDLIKARNSQEKVAEEANKMSKGINDAHVEAQRSTISNTFHVTENRGVVAGTIENSSISVISNQEKIELFAKETKKAIELINSFTDIDQKYRDALISLVKDADLAVKEDNEPKKTSCKEKFKGFILGAGSAVEKILTALSDLATIAGFFGIGVK